MKKILYSLMALSMAFMVSCSKDEIGETNSKEVAGQWYMVCDAVDDNGEVVYEDVFGLGRFMCLTFNTAADDPTEIYVSDLRNFWDFQIKVKCVPDQKVFGNTDWVDNESYDCKVLLTDGKIVLNGTTTPSGMPADYCEFCVQFDDDPYPGAYGYAKYKLSGYRYTGFTADD